MKCVNIVTLIPKKNFPISRFCPEICLKCLHNTFLQYECMLLPSSFSRILQKGTKLSVLVLHILQSEIFCTCVVIGYRSLHLRNPNCLFISSTSHTEALFLELPHIAERSRLAPCFLNTFQNRLYHYKLPLCFAFFHTKWGYGG